VAKPDEIAYAIQMNAEHARNKPFSDADCGRNLIRIGTLMTLLPPPPGRILDLGCGPGWTSLFFARAGYQVVGVDIAPEMIRLANEQCPANLTNVSFHVCDYESLTFQSEFDAVVFFDSLHHASNERLAISRAFEALKPGGTLLADEPGTGHSHSPESLEAVSRFGVTEKEMPPAYVVALGREAGFTGFQVFPHAHEVNAAIYGRRTCPAADPFAHIDPIWEVGTSASPLTKVVRRARFALSPYPAWRLSDVDHLSLHVRANGLVVMWKLACSMSQAA
jgi:SAM-dependent methyltransferase